MGTESVLYSRSLFSEQPVCVSYFSSYVFISIEIIKDKFIFSLLYTLYVYT